MRVGIATARVPFARNAGEARADELVQALRRAGHEAEIIPIPFNGLPQSRLAEQMLACRLLDLEESMGTRIDRLVSLTFPAYLVPHPAKVIWLLQRCRPAYDLWGTSHATLHTAENGEQLRRLVRGADARLISNARGVFVPSHSAGQWLRQECGIAATLLQAPPSYAERYRHAGEGDYFLLITPVGTPPRERLVVEAMGRTRNPVRLHVLGDFAEQPVESALASRITQSDAEGQERHALLGNCVAVIYAGIGETDGIVAFEAMLSEKPVITFDDTGAVAELVHDGQTGCVCPADPRALSETLDLLWENPSLARRLGRAAHSSYQDLRLSWDTVLNRLLA